MARPPAEGGPPGDGGLEPSEPWGFRPPARNSRQAETMVLTAPVPRQSGRRKLVILLLLLGCVAMLVLVGLQVIALLEIPMPWDAMPADPGVRR